MLQHKSTIVDLWFQAVLATYPADTAKYLAGESDQFQNPVGRTIQPALENLFVALVKGEDQGRVRSSLDSIIRIRAVQDFAPSGAVGFLFQLKKLLREQVAAETSSEDRQAELRALEDRIDEAALLAFDVYMSCREQIFSIRIKENKAQMAQLLRHRTDEKIEGRQ